MNRLTQLERLDLGSNEFTEVVSSHQSHYPCLIYHHQQNVKPDVFSAF